MAQPQRIRLFSPFSTRNRSILKDSRLYNGFVEAGSEQDDIWVYKRPGLKLYRSGSTAAGLGVFNWNDNIYHVAGTTLYKDGVNVGTVDASSHYTFSACLGATPKLFLKNETFAYTYDSGGGLVQVTDGDYPATTVPGCVYLDGTMYVMDGSDASIHGSDFNAPTSWNPLNKLLVQIEPEKGAALGKPLAYVVALKKALSSEVFYDAGNATGSPLGPVQGSKSGFGCRAPYSMVRAGDDLAWIATSGEASVQAVLMSRVKVEPVSDPSVDRVLEAWDYTTTFAWACKCSGHRYYGVTSKLSNMTFVFDLTLRTWYIWTDANGNYFPIVSSTHGPNGEAILQHETNGDLYTLDFDQKTDDGSLIPFKLYTSPWDGGARVYKTFPVLELIADQVDTSVNVSWTDDDYQTFTTPLSVNLNQDRPLIQAGSSFRKRAFLIEHAAATALRIKALEAQMSGGNV